MQSAEEFARRLRYREIEEQWDGENETYVDVGFGLSDQDAIEEVAARDAEWQARVEKLETTIKLQENMLRIYNEEFTKQGHRLFLVQARVKKLEAALEPTPDALELAMELRAKCYTHSNGGDYSGESSFDIDDAAQLIAAHDARLLDEAAERAVKWWYKCERHGNPDTLRAVVRGEGEK